MRVFVYTDCIHNRVTIIQKFQCQLKSLAIASPTSPSVGLILNLKQPIILTQTQLRKNAEKYMIEVSQNEKKLLTFFKHPSIAYAT